TKPVVKSAAADAATLMRTHRDLIDTTPPQSGSNPSKRKARVMPAFQRCVSMLRPGANRLEVKERERLGSTFGNLRTERGSDFRLILSSIFVWGLTLRLWKRRQKESGLIRNIGLRRD